MLYLMIQNYTWSFSAVKKQDSIANMFRNFPEKPLQLAMQFRETGSKPDRGLLIDFLSTLYIV